MKKLLLTLSLLLAGFYLVNAVSLNLSSGSKLDSTNWQNINNIVNKISLDNNNLNINGKLVSNGKICIGNSCLGECEDGYNWDSSTSTCKVKVGTQTSPGTSCLDLLNKGETVDGSYFITGTSGKTYEVYCDMTTDGGGWTLVAKSGYAHDVGSGRVAPTAESELIKYSRITAETTTGSLVDEFSNVSTQIRFKLPYLDEYVAISSLSENSARQILINFPTNANITLISGSIHKRVAMRCSVDDISKIYDYTLSYEPPTYGHRGGRYSTETGPAYVFLR